MALRDKSMLQLNFNEIKMCVYHTEICIIQNKCINCYLCSSVVSTVNKAKPAIQEKENICCQAQLRRIKYIPFHVSS